MLPMFFIIIKTCIKSYLDTHVINLLSTGMNGAQSYNANRSAPNAGNTASQPRQGRSGSDGSNNPDGGGGRGLGAIASGVSTPMDRYGNRRGPPDEEPRMRSRGGYGERSPNRFEQRGMGGPPPPPGMNGPGPSFGGPPPPQQRDPRGPPPQQQQRGPDPRDGRPNNLRYEERDYGEYVTNLRRGQDNNNNDPRSSSPPPNSNEYQSLQEEVESLRKENQLLKRSCQDLMNNFNDLSNRLFDVDESLKKVANVFPSEDEMESLEWLLRR